MAFYKSRLRKYLKWNNEHWISFNFGFCRCIFDDNTIIIYILWINVLIYAIILLPNLFQIIDKKLRKINLIKGKTFTIPLTIETENTAENGNIAMQ